MDENLASFLKTLNDGWQHAGALLSNPWNLLGIALVIAVYVAVRFGTRGLIASLEKRLAATSPVPQLVPLTQVLPKLVVAAATALILWLAIAVMREVALPSRSYVITVVASLLTAWVVIRLASSFIRNQLVARILAIVVWALAALNIVGYLQDSLTFFDRLAVDIGGLHLSLLTVVKAAIAVTLLLWGATAISAALERRLQGASDLTPSMRVLISKLARILLFILALVLAMRAVGVDLTSVAVFSGAIGLGIGFGLQKIVSNLISGVILLVDRSIKPGDVIEIGNTFGWVNALGARYTSVATRDGKEYLIPNEDLITQQVVNWSYSHDLVRLEVEFAVTFECDVHAVRKLAIQAATGVSRVLEQPAPLCHLKEFQDNGICFLLRFWIRDPQNGVVNVKSDVQIAVWDAFRHAGLRFAYPYREVYVRDRRDGRGAWPLPLAGD
jgi:small-conductance mechanosensitive channel